jgi:hypothetical protein
MNILQATAREAIKKHGGLIKASNALKVNSSVLSLMASGQKRSASPKTLKRLGLKREFVPISGVT